MKDFLSRKASPLTIIFVIICEIDLISTSIFLKLGASEANPLMNFLLEQGSIVLLTLVKSLTVSFALIIFELLKRKVSPKKYRNYCLAAIIGYLGVWGIAFMVVNF